MASIQIRINHSFESTGLKPSYFNTWDMFVYIGTMYSRWKWLKSSSNEIQPVLWLDSVFQSSYTVTFQFHFVMEFKGGAFNKVMKHRLCKLLFICSFIILIPSGWGLCENKYIIAYGNFQACNPNRNQI